MALYPVERVEEFFNAFTPSNETQIAVTMIDGTALTEGVTYSEGKPGDADTGIVSKPCDRVSAVEWKLRLPCRNSAYRR